LAYLITEISARVVDVWCDEHPVGPIEWALGSADLTELAFDLCSHHQMTVTMTQSTNSGGWEADESSFKIWL